MTHPPDDIERAAYTPGPWSIREYGDGDSLVVENAPNWRICFMATPGESPGAMAKIEANARLIAAAPDLLEALEAMIASCACHRAAFCPACNAGRAAIAKATQPERAIQGDVL